VLAYAIGEEGFTDLNGNGLVDQLITKQVAPLPPSPEMIDANNASTDTPEAWVDYNENGIRDALEPFIDFNINGLYDAADGLYNGVICDHTLVAGTPSVANPLASLACSLKQTIHAFRNITIVFSGSFPVATATAVSLNLGGCLGGAAVVGAGASTNVLITDVNTNLMPAGTKIDVSTTNGKLLSLPSYVVPNSIATNIPGILTHTVAGVLAPVSTIGSYAISVGSDAVVTPGNAAAVPPTPATCTDPTPAGVLNIVVTTPGAAGIAGTVTAFGIPVAN
jgi:hypothetical protein